MEDKFLLYLLYVVLIDVRARSYEINDKVSHGLCDLLHNVPLSLAHGNDSNEVYNQFCEKIVSKGLQEWLDNRKREFYTRFPEYNNLL
jgi:hypothetical protein